MALPPALRRAMLAGHIICSVGWLGAAAAYLALGVAAEVNMQPQIVRGAWIGMEVSGWFVIVPLGCLALVTGLVLSLGTPWGLFKHYWVVIALVLTTLSLAVLLLHMPSVSTLAGLARTADDAAVSRLDRRRSRPRHTHLQRGGGSAGPGSPAPREHHRWPAGSRKALCSCASNTCMSELTQYSASWRSASRRRRPYELPSDCELVDFGDATVLPGLIDTHVHLAGDSGLMALERVAGYSPEEIDAVVIEALRRHLAAGVTTVRDLGGS